MYWYLIRYSLCCIGILSVLYGWHPTLSFIIGILFWIYGYPSYYQFSAIGILSSYSYIYGVHFLYQSSHHYWFSRRISEDWSNLYHEKWYSYRVFYHRISPQTPKEFVIDLSYQTAQRKHVEGHYLWISCCNFEDEIHF